MMGVPPDVAAAIQAGDDAQKRAEAQLGRPLTAKEKNELFRSIALSRGATPEQAQMFGNRASFGDGAAETFGFAPRMPDQDPFSGIDPSIGVNTRAGEYREIGLKGFNETREAPQMQAASLGMAKGYDAAQFGGAQINQANQDQFRNQQMGQVNALQRIADGGPSAAQDQMRSGIEAAQRQQQALAASNAFVPGMSRQSARQQAAIAQRGVGDMDALRIQEQQQARQALGQMMSGIRGADVGLSAQQAGLTQQAGIASADAQDKAGQFRAGSENKFNLTRGDLFTDAGVQNLRAAGAVRGLDDSRQRSMFGLAVGADAGNARRDMTIGGTNEALGVALTGMKNKAALAQEEKLMGLASGVAGTALSLAGG